MSFSPNLFLSNIRGKDGLAKPCRFEVILPIPPYVNQFLGNSIIEKILNFPNSIFSDVSDAIGSAFGRQGDADEYSKTSNSSTSRYLALQCESAELPGRTTATADVKIYGPTFKVPYQTQYGDTSLTFLCTNDFYLLSVILAVLFLLVKTSLAEIHKCFSPKVSYFPIQSNYTCDVAS